MAKDTYEGLKLDDRYLMQRRLDSGSFGAVYEAVDLRFDSTVAIKILFEQNQETVSAFRKEARLAREFKHPHVVTVFDYGTDETLNVGYIVMEFLKGRRLDQVIADLSGPVPDRVIAQFVDEVGSALQSAHERNLIHRDLKPRNVMLVDETSSSERFVLLDLGLASKTTSTATLRNQTLDGALSPHYASPEQFNQSAVDFRSDIYSFGTVLYEMVTGVIPFPRDQLFTTMMAICKDPVPPFSEVIPGRRVPEDLEAVIRGCLEKTPDTRPQSIQEIRQRVLSALGFGTGFYSVQFLDAGIETHAGTLPSAQTDTRSPQKPRPRSSDGNSSAGVPRGTLAAPALDGRAAAESFTPGESAGPGFTGARPVPLRDRSSARADRAGQKKFVAALLIVLLPLLLVGWIILKPGDPDRPIPATGSEMPDGGTSGIVADPGVTKTIRTPARLILVDSASTLKSGGSGEFLLLVQPPAGETESGTDKLVISTSDHPSWLRLQIPPDLYPGKSITIGLSAARTTIHQDGEFVLDVQLGDWKDSARIPVHVTAPEPRALPAAFQAAPGAEIIASVSDPDVCYHQQIVRTVPPDLPVVFVLVVPPPRSSGGSRPLTPFYIMQDEVWNSLFAHFRDSTAGAAGSANEEFSEWQEGATAGADSLPASLHPQLPVVRVTADQAHEFAAWLSGSDGDCHLPSLEQWNAAAGLAQGFTASDPDRPDGPFRGRWDSSATDMALNRRSLGPRPVGTSHDDIAVTGCRDMCGNVTELTETLTFGGRIGDAIVNSDSQVVLRGQNYLSTEPLTWERLKETEHNYQARDETDPTIGFRVVLEIPD